MRVKFLLGAALLFCTPWIASAATLSVAPASVSVSAGDTVTVTVQVNSSDQAINAMSGTFLYPTSLLSVSSISKSGSVVSLWVNEPTNSSSDGSIAWSGVIPNPGYQGTGGRIFSVQFRAKAAGDATISFTQAAVLANDGNGTNVLTSAPSGKIIVSSVAPAVQIPDTTPTPTTAPASNVGATLLITSHSHPDQTQWYSSDAPQFSFTLPEDTLAVRTGIGQNPNGTPTVLYQPPIKNKTVTHLPDGQYYFSAQARTSDGWGTVARFTVNIDTQPPDPFTVTVMTSADGANTATFEARDGLSGVDRYTLLVNGTKVLSLEASEVHGSVNIPASPAGTSTLTVVAYDKAGNSAEAQAQFVSIGTSSPVTGWTFSISIPFEKIRTFAWIAINYFSVLLLVVCAIGSVLFVAWYAWHRIHTYRRRLLGRLMKTDRVLHAEFIALYEALTDEVDRLKKEEMARALTSQEKHVLARLSKLLQKTKKTIDKEHLRL